jgi:outer membrane protein OmpA-like peptidoglycan-associated protein
VTTVAVTLPSPPPIPDELTSLAQIVFPRNRSALPNAARERLNKVLERLQKNPEGRVSVEAYAGPDETRPQELAAARAEAVKRLLLENGVSESRVQVQIGVGGRLGGLRNLTLDVIWIPDGMEY